MHKTILIIKREYLTRIRKKTFIIGTILFPVLYLGLIFGTAYIEKKSNKDLNIAVVDSSGLFTPPLLAAENISDSSALLTLTNLNEAAISKDYEKLGYNGYIIIPQNTDWKTKLDVKFNSQKTYGSSAHSRSCSIRRASRGRIFRFRTVR